MTKTIQKFSTCVGVGGMLTIIEHLFGTFDCSLEFLLIVIVLDYITGLMCGWYNHDLESNKATRGLFKKMFIFIYIIIAHRLDAMLKVDYIRIGVCYMYAVGEVLSIMENGTKLGLPVPTPIQKALKILNESVDGIDDTEADKNDNNTVVENVEHIEDIE